MRRRRRATAELLDRLYDAAFEPGGWAAALDCIGVEFSSPNGSVQFCDLATNLWIAPALRGYSASSLEQYNAHYRNIDVWIDATPKTSLASFVRVSEHLPVDLLHRSEFHADFLRPYDLDYCIGAFLPIEPGYIGAVSLNRTHGVGDFTAEEQSRLDALVPHLVRAMQLWRRLDGAGAARELGFSALDCLAGCVILVDENGAILHANAAADALLAARDGLLREPGGRRLWAVESAATDRLMALVAHATARSSSRGELAGGGLTIPRRGKRPLAVLVTPLPADRNADGWQRPAALVFVTDPEASPPAAVEARLASVFRLTRAETRLASGLIAGLSVTQAANALALSRDTLKTQLRSIFAKTGTRRQSELLALVARLTAIR